MGYLAKFRIASCILILTNITTAIAQDQSTLSMAGCVDDNAMASCQATANTEFNNCVASSGNQKTQLLACGCEHYIQNINCAASACWNRVYECNYQGYVTWYLANCPTATTPVPYFPIPNGAPDACSCNLGAVYLAISSAFQQSTSCSNSAHGGDAVNEVYAQQACICCGISSALTSMFTTCPTTDPHLIGLNRILQEQTNLNQPWDNCGKSLSQYNCVGDLGFAQVGSGFYVPSNTPDANAIKGLMSNMGGVVESPGEGATFTYTAGDGRQYTITAATVNGKGGNSEGSSASGTSSAASSGSSSSSSSDQSKHNAGETLNVSMAAALIITLLYCIV